MRSILTSFFIEVIREMSKGYFVGAKKVASGGFLHLLQAPFGAAAAVEHCPNVLFQSGIAAGAVRVRVSWSLGSRPHQLDELIMHRALNSLIGINRN